VVKQTFIRDFTGVQIRTRGYLPHWEQPNATYSLTIRLHDSLPYAAIDRIRHEYSVMRRTVRSAIEKAELRAQLEQQIDNELHLGHGEAFMNDPRVADIVANTFTYFDGVRYELIAWCVMPNHMHAVITPFESWSLQRIVQSWKGYSARMANQVLRREGRFWQREYYDRIVRDEKDLVRTMAYVRNNPEKAGLKDWKWVGRPEAGAPAG